MRNRRLSQLIPFLIAVLLLWWVLRAVSLGEVWAVLRRIDPVDLLWLGLANIVVLWLLTGRWWVLLRALDIRIPFHRLVGYRLAAFGLSYFTPGPHFGGEPLQVYLPVRHHDAPTDAAVAAVTMDKTLELLVNFAFLVVAAIYILQQGVLAGAAGFSVIGYGLLLLALPVGLLIALWAGRHPLSGGLAFLARRWARPTLVHMTESLRKSEDLAAWLCRRRPAAVGGSLLFALLSWGAMIGEYWLATHVLGMQLTLGQAITAMLAARLAILLPLPAGLGALEASQVMAMNALGVGAAAGLSLALLIRTRDVILGLIGLWIGGVGLWPGLWRRQQATLEPNPEMEDECEESNA